MEEAVCDCECKWKMELFPCPARPGRSGQWLKGGLNGRRNWAQVLHLASPPRTCIPASKAESKSRLMFLVVRGSSEIHLSLLKSWHPMPARSPITARSAVSEVSRSTGPLPLKRLSLIRKDNSSLSVLPMTMRMLPPGCSCPNSCSFSRPMHSGFGFILTKARTTQQDDNACERWAFGFVHPIVVHPSAPTGPAAPSGPATHPQRQLS